MKQKNKFIIGWFFLIWSCHSSFQEINTSKLDVLLNTLGDNQLANGSIALSKDGNIAYQKELGFAFKSRDKTTKTSPATKYRIGSVSKMFTATIIFQLIEEKELRLNDNLATFMPNLPNANHITIETLLRHRSGLINYTDDPGFKDWKDKPKPSGELLHFFSTTTPKFSPDRTSNYSNTNFLLLSLIIEKICKKPFQEVLAERILSKINLKSTYFENAPDTALKNSKSYKYFNSAWFQQPETVASNHLGAGALVSTATDLVIFMDALFSDKLVTAQSLKSITSFNGDYGMGIFKISYNNRDYAYGHEGRIDEFYTSLIHYPIEKITIAFCSNGILYPKDDIMKKVTEVCLNRNSTIPNFEPVTKNAQISKQLAGKYSSSDRKISVVCNIKNNILTVTTQSQNFETKQIDKNYFANLQYGYFFEFIHYNKQLIIKETDNIYILSKENS